MNFENYDDMYKGDSPLGSESRKLSGSFTNGLKQVGRKGMTYGKKAGSKLAEKSKRAAKEILKKLVEIIGPKGVLIIICCLLLVLFVLGACYSCSYYMMGNENGENGNYVSDNNTKIISDDGDEITNIKGDKKLSAANSTCISYYSLLSREKSCWQKIKDDSGKVSLVQYGDDRAVSDAFGNDENYFINPNLLYAMNRYLYSNDYVYPEAFLKPVAYTINKKGEYKLQSLTDKNGHVQVKSAVYDSNGNKADIERKSVSDYGIGSVLVYDEKSKKTKLKGKYIKQDYYDSSTGKVEQKVIDESFEILLKEEKDNVIKTAVTFAGVINYTYTDDSTLVTQAENGESSNPNDNVTKILYDTVEVSRYYCKNGSVVKKFSTKKEMEDYVKTNSGYTIAKDDKGKYKQITDTYKLYKYRDSISGIYLDFVKKKDSKITDQNTDYLYDYLQNFETYKPVMDRTNNYFRNVSYSASFGELSAASSSDDEVSLGSGNNDFEMLYNGSKKKVIEEVWSGLINYGLTPEQSAAILGNITQESGFRTDAVDDLGAYGLCQFMGNRKTKLFTFAKSVNKENQPSVRSQTQYIAMETLGGGKWADNAWQGHDDDRQTFESSMDIDELTRAFCNGYERPDEALANMPKRQRCARSAYNILRKLNVKADNKIIVKDGVSSGGSTENISSGKLSSLTNAEQEEFNTFYHQVDDIYNGKFVLDDYYGGLTRDKAEMVIKTANSFINGTTILKESLNIDNQMWSETYLTDLSQKDISFTTKKNEGTTTRKADVFVAYKGEYVLPVLHPVVTDDYGPRVAPTAGASTNHMGVDFAASYGDPIRAAKDGTVIVAEFGNSGGFYVIIDHGKDKNGDTIWTMYLHNSRLCVKVGDKVVQGQKIAEAGSTGVSTGVHCHLSVFKNGSYDDPHKYFTIP